MSIEIYNWEAEPQFLGRVPVLRRLEDWWDSADVQPFNLFGRRRVGKSWLFRKFAHGKPAIVLVAENTLPTLQFSRLADQLEPHMVARPDIRDISTLFRVIYEVAKNEKTLVVIDEFPNLLGNTDSDRQSALSSIQAVMENYRDKSRIKLILCGSAISQMEALQSEGSPLHGRLLPLELVPLTFAESRDYFEGSDIIDHFTRYSITGGMPRYLALLGKGDLGLLLAGAIVDPNAPLFGEVPSLLAAELKETSVYFAILSELANNAKDRGSIANAIGKDGGALTHYFDKLEAMRLLKRKHPVGADPDGRATQYECIDGFVRFWFRFIAPYRADLEGGASPVSYVDTFIKPNLADHAAVEFEHVFQRWIRQQYPSARQVSWWWGKAANVHRAAKTRSTQEIDAVGIAAKKVILVGEAKWTNGQLSPDVINDLIQFKLPALTDAGFRSAESCEIVITSRAGFSQSVMKSAEENSRIRLVEAQDLLREVV